MAPPVKIRRVRRVIKRPPPSPIVSPIVPPQIPAPPKPGLGKVRVLTKEVIKEVPVKSDNPDSQMLDYFMEKDAKKDMFVLSIIDKVVQGSGPHPPPSPESLSRPVEFSNNEPPTESLKERPTISVPTGRGNIEVNVKGRIAQILVAVGVLLILGIVAFGVIIGFGG